MFVLCCASLPVVRAQPNWQEEFSSLRETVHQQQRVIEQQGRWIEAQQRQLDNLALASDTPRSSGHHGITAEYDGGFVFASRGDGLGKSYERFMMRIGSWGQLRHNFFDSDGPNPDQNDLELERLRLVFDGHAFNTSFRYFFQLDADSDAGETVDMLDYYVTYDFGRDLFCWDSGRLALRFGKWKIGFNRAREESGTRMQFSDRSIASVLFDFDRSLGLGLLGRRGQFDWQVTVANGIDTGGFRSSRSGDLDRNVAVAARINWLASGYWGTDGHADLDWRHTPAIRLGTGFTYTRPDLEGAREFAFPRVVDSGATIDTVLPVGTTAYNMYMYSGDLNLKYRGFSFVFEYYARQFAGFSAATLDHGYWAELGYFVVPNHLQLLARHSRIVGSSGTLGVANRSADEVAAGFVIYVRKHNLKATFDVTHLNGAPVNDTALNIRPGDAGWLYRTQLQWKF